jgi:hypothetical protein
MSQKGNRLKRHPSHFIYDSTIQRTMKQKLLHYALSLTGTLALTGALGQQGKIIGATDPAGLDRTVLPIKEPTYPESTVLDAREAKPPPRFEVKAPANIRAMRRIRPLSTQTEPRRLLRLQHLPASCLSPIIRRTFGPVRS